MRKFKYIAAVAGMVLIMGSLNPTGVQAAPAGTEVSVDGETLYIRNSFDDSLIPDGFSKGTMQYNNNGISVLNSSDEQVTLVYLADENGENGAFYRYETDGEHSNFSKYIQISGSGRYLIVTDPPADTSIPDGYTEVSVQMEGQDVKAYQEDGFESEFYLVYGLNDEQVEGLYRYDSSDGTYLRYVETSTAAEADPGQVEILQSRLTTLQDEYEANQDMLFKIMCGLMALSGVLFLIIVNMLFKISSLKKSRGGRAEEADLDMLETEDHFVKEIPHKAAKKKRRQKRRKEAEDDLEELDTFTEDLSEVAEELEAEIVHDFNKIKVDVNDAEPKKVKKFKRAPEPEEDYDEDFLDDGMTGDLDEVAEELAKTEEEPERVRQPVEDNKKRLESDKNDSIEEIEDYDDFELEILDLDEE